MVDWASPYFLYGWLGIKDQLSVHSYLRIKDQLFVHVCPSEAFVTGGCLCFRFDASDLPLLLSIAGTHTPNLALGSEAKVRSPLPWPVILTTGLAQQMAAHVSFPFDQNPYKQLKWYLSIDTAAAVVYSIYTLKRRRREQPWVKNQPNDLSFPKCTLLICLSFAA